ncbi:MAG: DUF4421 family protein [Chitinophagaceae bacterium]
MYKSAVSFVVILMSWFTSNCQGRVDSNYISDFKLPYVVKLCLERTGAGLDISPDNTLAPPSASFRFNTGLNLGLNLSYKFLNLSVSQSLHSRTNNRSLSITLNTYNGAVNFGGKVGFYSNVAALKDKKTLNVRTSINLFKVSPYWLLHPNYKRLSLAAIRDFSQLQRRSAGSFMFEINPLLIHGSGKDGPIIPSENYYVTLFDKMSGLKTLTIINLDIRPGYVYTKVFDEGRYFLTGGLFLGTGFGYHHAHTESITQNGMHWQTSLRMSGSVGYNGDDYFIAGSFRYTNSFTPMSSIGVLAEESSFMLILGLRFNALEDALPGTWKELFHKK